MSLKAKLFKKRPSKRGSLVDLSHLGLGKSKAPKEEDVRRAREQAQLRAQWRRDVAKLRVVVDKLRDVYAGAKGGFAVGRYEQLKTMIKDAVLSYRNAAQEIKDAKLTGSLRKVDGGGSSAGGSVGGTLERQKKSGGLMARLRNSAQNFATHDDMDDLGDGKSFDGKSTTIIHFTLWGGQEEEEEEDLIRSYGEIANALNPFPGEQEHNYPVDPSGGNGEREESQGFVYSAAEHDTHGEGPENVGVTQGKTQTVRCSLVRIYRSHSCPDLYIRETMHYPAVTVTPNPRSHISSIS